MYLDENLKVLLLAVNGTLATGSNASAMLKTHRNSLFGRFAPT
jgi:hypothetical protein